MRGLCWIGLLSLSTGCHLIFPHQVGGHDAHLDALSPDGQLPDRSSICTFPSGCGVGRVCDLRGCDATSGTCVLSPSTCLTNLDPVCGCDGRTYGNDCERLAALVALNHLGACAGRSERGVGPEDEIRAPDVGLLMDGALLPPVCKNCSTSQCCNSPVGCVKSDESHCGRPGEICVVCVGGQSCVSGRCILNPCDCNGCCESDICYPGNNPLHCGPVGQPCEACTLGKSCYSGECK